ncbi:hypothetical protein BGX30_006023, partial [Mortierella sp. GBA39]
KKGSSELCKKIEILKRKELLPAESTGTVNPSLPAIQNFLDLNRVCGRPRCMVPMSHAHCPVTSQIEESSSASPQLDDDSIMCNDTVASQGLCDLFCGFLYDDGYTQGSEEGYSKGFDVGFLKGSDDGFAKGFEEGYSKGVDVGFLKGSDDGFAKG